LTKELLEFCRRGDLTTREVDANRVVMRAAPLLRRLLRQTELTITFGRDASVWIAEPYLEQILSNLVINARDAMPAGGQVRVATWLFHAAEPREVGEWTLAPGAYFVLSVTDSGTGIDPATLARIYEPFFTTKARRGTGLGLSIVREIVDNAKGAIGIVTTPGSGTTVSVYLSCASGLSATPRRCEP
jgi:two-component system, cell cycle sensor histidine kinase and response regulator CckA